MKKMGSFLMMLVVMNLLALGGLGGYLVATGRLDQPKAGAIVDLLRHKGTPEKIREQLYEIMEPAAATTSAPATQGSGTAAVAEGSSGPGSVLGASASDRLEISRQVMEQERIKLEGEAQELRNRQKLLLDLQRDVNDRLAKMEKEKESYQKLVAADEGKGKEASFQKALALYDELKPKQIKEIFLGMPVDQVAGYVQAMEASRAGKIIAEFKSPTEQTFISGVLDRIRGVSAGSGTSAARTSVSSNAMAPAGL